MNKENNSMCFGMRLIARFIVFFYLFQISFTSYATVLSNAEIEYQLDSNLLFEYVPSSREYIYEESEAVQSQAPNAIDLNAFYETIFDSHNELLPPPVLIPISTGGITTIIPTYPRDKLVGPALVQSRLVRTQIKELLGRNLINQSAPGGAYVNEVAQLNTLYNNTLSLLGNSSAVLSNIPGLEFGLPLNRSTQDSGLEKDIIWPELRTIRGQEVVVPIVYLTKATYDQNRVNGHTIQFAGNASFDNLTIDNSTVRFERDAFLNVAGNLTNTEGVIVGNGDLDIVAGGVLHNISSLITAVDGDLTILADRIESRTLVHRYDFNGGHSERFGDVSEISAAGDVTLRSYNDILVSGTDVVSENESIRFAADGNIYIVAQAASVQSTRPVGGWRVNQTSSVDYLSSTLTAEDAIELIANGNILIDASEIVAGNGHLEILAGLGITVQEELEQTQYHRRGRFGKTKIETSLYKTVAIRSLLDSGRGITLHAGFGDITLRAADIRSVEGATVTAENGGLNLLVTRENDHYSYSSVRKGLFTVRTVNRGHEIETVVPNTIVGGFTTDVVGQVVVEFPGDPDLDLDQQLDVLQEFEGLQWIRDVRSSYTEAEWVAIREKHREWNERSTSLSPAALAVVAIAAAVVVGPGVSNIVGNLGNAVVTNAVTAGVTSVISQAAVAGTNALISGEDPLEVAFDTLTSSDTVQAALQSAITAGAISAIDAEFFKLGEGETGNPRIFEAMESGNQALTLQGQAIQAVTHSAVRAGVDVVLNGGNTDDFTNRFVTNLAQEGINQLGKFAANRIKGAFEPSEPGVEATNLQTALRYISHAGAGCILGELQGDLNDAPEGSSGCAVGATGAVVGEFIGDLHRPSAEQQQMVDEVEDFLEKHGLTADVEVFTEEQVKAFREQFGNIDIIDTANELRTLQARGVNLAKLGAGLTALVAGGDAASVNIAAFTGQNAAENNALFLIPIAIALLKAVDIALTAKEYYDIYAIYQTEGKTAGDEALAKFLGDKVEGKVLEEIIKKIFPGATLIEVLVDELVKRKIITPRAGSYLSDLVADSEIEAIGESRFTFNTNVTVNSKGTVSRPKSRECGCAIELTGVKEKQLQNDIRALQAQLRTDTSLTSAQRGAIRGQIGEKNEEITQLVFEADGWKVHPFKYNNNDNGIDFVASRIDENGVERIAVIEAKPFDRGGTSLKSTTSGFQLSDTWIQGNLDNYLMSNFVTDEGMRVAGILQQMLMNMQQLEKLVTGVDRQVDPNLSVPPFRVVSVDGL